MDEHEAKDNDCLLVAEPRLSKPVIDVPVKPDPPTSTNPQPLLLGQRPPLSNARRLTIHDASSSRPGLLTKQLSFKSSSAVPTLSTLAATSTVSSSAQPTISSTLRRTNSGSGLTPNRNSGIMAASATHLLKQAISHR